MRSRKSWHTNQPFLILISGTHDFLSPRSDEDWLGKPTVILLQTSVYTTWSLQSSTDSLSARFALITAQDEILTFCILYTSYFLPVMAIISSSRSRPGQLSHISTTTRLQSLIWDHTQLTSLFDVLQLFYTLANLRCIFSWPSDPWFSLFDYYPSPLSSYLLPFCHWSERATYIPC